MTREGRNGWRHAAAASRNSDYLFSDQHKLQQAAPCHRFFSSDRSHMNPRLKNQIQKQWFKHAQEQLRAELVCLCCEFFTSTDFYFEITEIVTGAEVTDNVNFNIVTKGFMQHNTFLSMPFMMLHCVLDVKYICRCAEMSVKTLWAPTDGWLIVFKQKMSVSSEISITISHSWGQHFSIPCLVWSTVQNENIFSHTREKTAENVWLCCFINDPNDSLIIHTFI